MDIIQKITTPKVTEYYYQLEFEKEKYTTWLSNLFNSDCEHFDGNVYSSGFIYRNNIPTLTVFSMNYEEKFKGELRGEFFEKDDNLFLKISVLSRNRIQTYLIPIITSLVPLVITQSLIAPILWVIFGVLILYENNRMTIYRGNQLLKTIEDLLELKKKISREEVIADHLTVHGSDGDESK